MRCRRSTRRCARRVCGPRDSPARPRTSRSCSARTPARRRRSSARPRPPSPPPKTRRIRTPRARSRRSCFRGSSPVSTWCPKSRCRCSISCSHTPWSSGLARAASSSSGAPMSRRALPAPLTIAEERTVGASLGKDSINDGIRAGVVGVALVVLIMVGYYRLSGLLAVSALTLYVLFTLAGLAAFGFTLTLPGLAWLVLSVGIAVDANVLIFERIREELQHGKLVRTAVDEGFTHAMSAIVYSNVSTMLTAIILWLRGPGCVLGVST